MAKRAGSIKAKKNFIKRGPTRIAKKKEMLRIKALKPVARRKALADAK